MITFGIDCLTPKNVDTLDLQDQDYPSSQDHSRKSAQHLDFGDNLIGSHHAAEIRQVENERHDEERNLQQAWGDATDGTTDTVADQSAAVATETETQTYDDMLDRMSSSPSIVDGQ